MIKRLNNSKGITLIALVITIIVLLILAGVAISMLSGENGILNQAAKAKTKTDNASEKEQVELAALAALTAGHGDVDDDRYYEVLNSELGKIKGYKGEIKKGDLPKTITIGNNSYTIKLDGTIGVATDTDKLPTVKAGEYASQKSKYIDSNNKVAVIPEGFTVSNVKTATVDETTIKSGLVIYKGDLSEETDMSDFKEENDQFVWIPVDDPSTMYGIKDNGEYYGRLYNFYSDGTTPHLNWYEEVEGTEEQLTTAQNDYDNTYATIQYVLNNSNDTVKNLILEAFGTLEPGELMELFWGIRPNSIDELKDYLYFINSKEPAGLPEYTNGDGTFGDPTKGIELLKSIVGLSKESEEDKGIYLQWEEQLKQEFKEMIESVEANKGFYVGRYETSLNADKTKAQVKSGIQSATSAQDSANTWYGLYQRQKEYSEKNNLTNIVGSTMIWGSQYDQMMIWMQKNGTKVTENIGSNRNPGTGSSAGTTGTTETDKINNIYDLYGNGYEWTLEANGTDGRVNRRMQLPQRRPFSELPLHR